MIKSLIFDFGGTIDTNGIHWIEKFWSAYQQHSIQISKDEFINAYIFSERKMNEKIKPEDTFKTTLRNQLSLQLEYLDNNKIWEGNENEITAVAEECFSDVEKNVYLFKSIISELSENFTFAVVSNFYGNLKAVLEGFYIKNLFKVITDSAAVKIRKPDPEIFYLTLKELAVMPEEAIVIGDSYENDIQPAKGIGCKTIWLIKKTYKEREENFYSNNDSMHAGSAYQQADYKISSLGQLPLILKSNILQKTILRDNF